MRSSLRSPGIRRPIDRRDDQRGRDSSTPESPPAGFDGAGLAVVFQLRSCDAPPVHPAGIKRACCPAWYREPDATGESKLSTLAQELSMLPLPASHIGRRVSHRAGRRLTEGLAQGGTRRRSDSWFR